MMNPVSNKIKITLLSVASVIGLASIVSCASKPEKPALPDCNYAANISASEQIKTFIWRDKNHATFAKDWQQISLLEVAKRYQYLQRKSLADAVQAKNEIAWLASKLNSLESINNNLLAQIESNTCNNQQAPQSLAALKQQTAGVATIRTGLAAIAQDIEAKTETIQQAIESK